MHKSSNAKSSKLVLLNWIDVIQFTGGSRINGYIVRTPLNEVYKVMRKFLTCLSIAALTILPSAIKVCAEPPPVEVETIIISSELGSLGDCDRDCP